MAVFRRVEAVSAAVPTPTVPAPVTVAVIIVEPVVATDAMSGVTAIVAT